VIAEIEEGSEPGVLCANEVGIFAKVEDGCVGESRFVDGLKHVSDASELESAELF
jgi:hypothetical protein